MRVWSGLWKWNKAVIMTAHHQAVKHTTLPSVIPHDIYCHPGNTLHCAREREREGEREGGQRERERERVRDREKRSLGTLAQVSVKHRCKPV